MHLLDLKNKFLTNILIKLTKLYKVYLIKSMSFKRSKSCFIKRKFNQTQREKQAIPTRKYSMGELKNRSRQKNEGKLFKQKILNYIQKRSDVQIIIFYQKYKEQFFRKSHTLQDLLYQKPEIKEKYLSEQNCHFFRGFQQTMLNLFRRKIIVPGSYNNMRQQVVEQIQKWVLSWIQRQRLYEQAKNDQQQATEITKQILMQIEQFARKSNEQIMPF